MIAGQIIEFFWLMSSLVLFGYAVLSKFRWKENVHQSRKTRMNSYKSQNLPRNQFVIEEAEEQQQCKSEEDLPQQQQQQENQSIAQIIRPKVNYLINVHFLLSSVAIINILNGGDNIFLLVMVILYLVSTIMIVAKFSMKWLFIPQLMILAMMINYLIVI
ncbi:unnamed protein product (macronuclear) [Paramecium tetraurelia]|uniref:Uncharacterized protein n=1 Tax=Paramecium tetraurelia TaxID=5888 RepID=A0D9R3_PARTE|nr:uncharacterized protein GSPATT00014711001 [Paramecium tetraurelia]CAK79780.1 unnamed protein product [Paramecium tetraurelia]|eukprot:XP_001447177.1 hypothetical protein (macronuclear) [Paramecium tetraurelia strain d4-2]